MSADAQDYKDFYQWMDEWVMKSPTVKGKFLMIMEGYEEGEYTIDEVINIYIKETE